jgi:HlyD family secretion protein
LRLTRQGATLGGAPILQLGDTRHFDVVAEVYESDVRFVVPGRQATVTASALPETLHGTVDKVLWTIERNRTRDLNPTAPEDLRVVEVRIRLDDAEVAKHRALLEKLINLQVHVRIARD